MSGRCRSCSPLAGVRSRGRRRSAACRRGRGGRQVAAMAAAVGVVEGRRRAGAALVAVEEVEVRAVGQAGPEAAFVARWWPRWRPRRPAPQRPEHLQQEPPVRLPIVECARSPRATAPPRWRISLNTQRGGPSTGNVWAASTAPTSASTSVEPAAGADDRHRVDRVLADRRGLGERHLAPGVDRRRHRSPATRRAAPGPRRRAAPAPPHDRERAAAQLARAARAAAGCSSSRRPTSARSGASATHAAYRATTSAAASAG